MSIFTPPGYQINRQQKEKVAYQREMEELVVKFFGLCIDEDLSIEDAINLAAFAQARLQRSFAKLKIQDVIVKDGEK